MRKSISCESGEKMIRKNKQGFSLAEVLIATVVFTLAFVGILLSYLRSMELNEMSRNSSLAVAAVKSEMEKVKDTAFGSIAANFDNKKEEFTADGNGINGWMVSYVDDTNPKLLKVTISFCWKQKSGLKVGEDSELNGTLDVGEDKNGNGMIDSIAQVVSYVYDKE